MIYGYCGRPGAGKTYGMVSDAYAEYKRGRKIYSNMSLSWATDITCWEDMVGVGNAIILLDEAGIWFNSRSYKDTPKEVLAFCAQSRKRGVDLYYTIQLFEALDKQIRGLTSLLWDCQRYGPILVQRAKDPGALSASGSLGMRVKIVSAKIYRLYDTYEVIGGAEKALGDKGAAKVEERIKWLCENGLVMTEEGLRRPGIHDIIQQAEIRIFDEIGEKWTVESTNDLDLWREIYGRQNKIDSLSGT